VHINGARVLVASATGVTGLEAARIGGPASRADGSLPAALSSVAAAPLRLLPPPCPTRPSTRSLTHPAYPRGLLADRAAAGTAPLMTPGGDLHQAVRAVALALESEAELVRAAPDGTSVVERRAR
jgi:hypothetical protein